jgi:hypothetical protein
MGRNGQRIDEAARCRMDGCEARAEIYPDRLCPAHHALFRLLFDKHREREKEKVGCPT